MTKPLSQSRTMWAVIPAAAGSLLLLVDDLLAALTEAAPLLPPDWEGPVQKAIALLVLAAIIFARLAAQVAEQKAEDGDDALRAEMHSLPPRRE